MEAVAIGFWGAAFGTAALMLAGALAFAHVDRRVAIGATVIPFTVSAFIVTYLGWLPIADPALQGRVAAHVAIVSALVLWLILLADLGLLRAHRARQRALLVGAPLVALALAGAWLVEPGRAAVYGAALSFTCSIASLGLAWRSAWRGDRLAWFGVAAVAWLTVGLAGWIGIALHGPGAPWPLHALSATAAMAYLACVGVLLWRRYSFLIELREVRGRGPRYDPITRMQATGASGALLAQALRRRGDPQRPVMLLAASIANLYALENLHGRPALNHALFVCASRLRRCVPADVEMARLFDDGFLLVAPDAGLELMAGLARTVLERLGKPITLRSGDGGANDPAEWVAQVGVGLLPVTSAYNPAASVAQARAMARTAWSFDSRIACDDGLDAVSELTLATPAG